MLAVPYFERALYELPASELTPENVLALADATEAKVQGGLSPRPLMSVPHILADESSAYYHGYVLAEMAVHQTRAHFLAKEGRIVDNANVRRRARVVVVGGGGVGLCGWGARGWCCWLGRERGGIRGRGGLPVERAQRTHN